MQRLLLFFLSCTLAVSAEKIRILRDEFGVPHIFASTPAGAAYGSGYAQAEDRLEEMMRNYRKAEGTMSEVFGESWFRHDHRQRMWGHRQVAEEHYKELDPERAPSSKPSRRASSGSWRSTPSRSPLGRRSSSLGKTLFGSQSDDRVRMDRAPGRKHTGA
jgi:hypothetical protein